MNKVLLLIFSVFFFGTDIVRSQNLTGPSSAMSGTELTLTATGESNTVYITSATIDQTGTEIASPSGTSAVWATANLRSFIMYNPTTKEPTKITILVSNGLNIPITAKFKFLVNSVNNNQPVNFQPKYFIITINPDNTPITHYNKTQSRAFVRNNCVDGLVGASVTYTIPANKYSSIISQQDADMKATNDINANGQGYANNQGGCLTPNPGDYSYIDGPSTLSSTMPDFPSYKLVFTGPFAGRTPTTYKWSISQPKWADIVRERAEMFILSKPYTNFTSGMITLTYTLDGVTVTKQKAVRYGIVVGP